MGRSTIDHVDWVVCLSEEGRPGLLYEGRTRPGAANSQYRCSDAPRRLRKDDGTGWLAYGAAGSSDRIPAYGVLPCRANLRPLPALITRKLAPLRVRSFSSSATGCLQPLRLASQEQSETGLSCSRADFRILSWGGARDELLTWGGQLDVCFRHMTNGPHPPLLSAAALTRTRRAQQFSVRLMSARGSGQYGARERQREGGRKTAHAYCLLRLARDAAGTDRVPRRRVGLQVSNFEVPILCNGHETVHSLTKQRQNHGLETTLPSRPANLHC